MAIAHEKPWNGTFWSDDLIGILIIQRVISKAKIFNKFFDLQDFFGAVSESCAKIAVHSKNMVKKMLVNGDIQGLLAILGGLALARNKVSSWEK